MLWTASSELRYRLAYSGGYGASNISHCLSDRFDLRLGEVVRMPVVALQGKLVVRVREIWLTLQEEAAVEVVEENFLLLKKLHSRRIPYEVKKHTFPTQDQVGISTRTIKKHNTAIRIRITLFSDLLAGTIMWNKGSKYIRIHLSPSCPLQLCILQQTAVTHWKKGGTAPFVRSLPDHLRQITIINNRIKAIFHRL